MSLLYAYNCEIKWFLICLQIVLVCLSQTTNCAILHMDREGTHSKVAGFVLVSYTVVLADRRASSSKLCQREAELSEAGDSVGNARKGWCENERHVLLYEVFSLHVGLADYAHVGRQNRNSAGVKIVERERA